MTSSRNEQRFVERALPGLICARCGATLDTYADKCSVSLDSPCPGFLAIEAARAEFKARAISNPTRTAKP